jgi:Flp pilus assembly protein TadD
MGLPVGTILARRYRVVERLGEGGMGSVYRVEDVSRPGVVWAAKELLDDAAATAEDIAWAQKRFTDEIALMGKLSHARIPKFVESFSEGGRRYFIMELIPGENLEERLARTHGPLPERDVLGWLIGVCEVLEYLHSRNPQIIVRDLKPGNIMVTPEGEVRLIDFGIARTYKPGQRSNTENLGTMTYASPEHLGQTQTDTRSDIYSLGATMFHLLTNKEPTPLETPAPGLIRSYTASVSKATEEIVRRAMRQNPLERFQNAHEMREALQQALNALNPAATQAQPRPPAPVVLPKGAGATPPAPASRPSASARQAPVQRAPQTRAAITQSGSLCPYCGYLNRPGARFCARDGTALQVGVTASPDGYMAPSRVSGSVPETRVVAAGNSAELSQRRATEAFSAGRYPQAVRQCNEAIAQGRATYDVYLLLGQAYRRLDRPAEAAQALGEAVKLRPTAEASLEQGLAQREAHQLDQALITFTKTRQLAPRDPEACYQLGLACLDLGQLAQAEGELHEALTLRPYHAPTLVALGRVGAARKQWQVALALYAEAAAADPSDPAPHLESGRVFLAMQRPKDALKALEQAARLAPASAEVQTALGVCYHAVGRRTQAREALRRALEIQPGAVEAQQLLKKI